MGHTRPGLFMQNTFAQAVSDKARPRKLYCPSPRRTSRSAFIDVRDTGAVGARILLDPMPHLGKIYEFTGAISNFTEFADAFSQVLGRKIAYVAITAEQAEQGMKARGMPDWLITHQLTAADIASKGVLSTETTSESGKF